MNHRSEILRHIADTNMADRLIDARILQRRTLIRPQAIATALVDMQRDGLIETHGETLYLTEAGWEQFEREKPRPVSIDLLLSHSDGGGPE